MKFIYTNLRKYCKFAVRAGNCENELYDQLDFCICVIVEGEIGSKPISEKKEM